MIDIRELRIGNTIKNPAGYNVQVSDLSYYVDKCHGIPLTPEWLERMGFKEVEEQPHLYQQAPSNYPNYFIGFNHPAGDNHTYQLYIGGYPNMKFTATQIEYVHQLQNLYFALTGKELEIKP